MFSNFWFTTKKISYKILCDASIRWSTQYATRTTSDGIQYTKNQGLQAPPNMAEAPVSVHLDVLGTIDKVDRAMVKLEDTKYRS
jgi:hypothetical protein